MKVFNDDHKKWILIWALMVLLLSIILKYGKTFPAPMPDSVLIIVSGMFFVSIFFLFGHIYLLSRLSWVEIRN